VTATLPLLTFTERIAMAWHEAGNHAADRLIAATRQNDDEAAGRWEREMARCDDQADMLRAMVRKGWL
jgi:hypothetical protein